MPDPSTAELVRRSRAGESCAAIAAETGSRPTTVQGRLKRAGVKFRPPGGPASRVLSAPQTQISSPGTGPGRPAR
jgi:hypothetical protein